MQLVGGTAAVPGSIVSETRPPDISWMGPQTLGRNNTAERAAAQRKNVGAWWPQELTSKDSGRELVSPTASCGYVNTYGDYGMDRSHFLAGSLGACHTSMQQWDSYVDGDALEDIAKDQASALIESCTNQVWELSKSVRYCRLIQHAFELADEKEQVALVSELRTRVVEATMDPNANHVLQRAIELMSPGSVHFVLQELIDYKKGMSELAKHRYGCRVLERLIEHFPPELLERLVDEMLSDAHSLLGHPFGNFVMQHLLEHGHEGCKRALVRLLLCRDNVDLKFAAAHPHACSVLDKALSYAHPQDQSALAKQVLDIDGLLATMACHRGGFAATQRVFKVVSDDKALHAKAQQQLSQRAAELLGSKHGRALVAQVHPALIEGHPAKFAQSPRGSRYGGGGGGHRGSGGYGHRGHGRTKAPPPGSIDPGG